MISKAAQKFDELCEIEDLSERIKVASEKFSSGKISAKAIRMLYNILDEMKKTELIDAIYDDVNSSNTLENMRRCPSKILLPQEEIITRRTKMFITKLLAYDMVYTYKFSKEKSKIKRFEEMYRTVYRKFVGKYNISFGGMEIPQIALREFFKKRIFAEKNMILQN